MSSPTIAPAWASIEDAATYLGVHPGTVRRRIAEGKLKAYRLGGKLTIRVKLADLDALLTPIPTAGGASK